MKVSLARMVDLKKTKVKPLVDKHTRIKNSKVVRGVRLPCDCIASGMLPNPDGGVVLFVTYVGMHSLYYAVSGDGYLFIDEYKFRLSDKALNYKKAIGKIGKVEAGQCVFISKQGSVEKIQYEDKYKPTARTSQDFDASVRGFEKVFLEAAEEMYDLAGKPPVTAMISGGTDSPLCAWALKEIGADITSVCVGRNADNFDPHYAELYARDLGIDYELIKLPTSKAGIVELRDKAIAWTEQYEMSNTLMAMCSVLVMERAAETRFKMVSHGYFADSLVGLSNVTIGAFKKEYPNGTDQDWAEYRAGLYQHIIPNDTQVAKVSRYLPEINWFSFFYHPKVARYVWETPLIAAPLEYQKPLFQAVLEKHIKTPAWKVKKKKGYYTGAGIGSLRLENLDILGDKALSAAYKSRFKK